MKFIYILEDDERTQKDLYETLKDIDPHLGIRFFLNLEEFHQWLKTALHDGPKALALGGRIHASDTSPLVPPSTSHELRLVIAKDEFLGTKNMGLIKRAREFFLRKKMCSEQDPTALILTAFDSPDFNISLAEERIINNVIFKPFDKLILRQHLEYALIGRHAVTPSSVASMQLSSSVEMLKEIQIQSISEVGFTTINNHEIKIGALTKYYGAPFTTNSKRSVLATCHASKEISPKEFLCEFHFCAIDNQQISQIRRNILQNKDHKVSQIKNSPSSTARLLILEEDADFAQETKLMLEDKFANTEIYHYTHISQLLSDLAGKETVRKQDLPSQFDLILANYDLFEIEKERRWEQITQLLKERAEKHGQEYKGAPSIYLISRKNLPAPAIRELTGWVNEIFFTPLDKPYFTKKLMVSKIPLVNKNPVNIASVKDESLINVANSVEITQISEAGLIMKYYREISIGSFRDFMLPRSEEGEAPEIPATVNFTEEQKTGEGFLNHFVFFGMKDHYLKYIRLWLLDAYIKGKDKDG